MSDTSAQSRQEIIAAAAKAFMEQGYAATSIDTVAVQLGATKGRIYYHYRSKADLLFDVHREAMHMNLATIRPIASQETSATQRLCEMARAHAYLVINHLPMQRVSVQGIEMHLSGSTTPEQREVLNALIDMRDAYERCFIDVLAAGVDTGEFRALNPRRVVKPLLGALNWMTVWYQPSPDETDETRSVLAQEHADFVLAGVKA